VYEVFPLCLSTGCYKFRLSLDLVWEEIERESSQSQARKTRSYQKLNPQLGPRGVMEAAWAMLALRTGFDSQREPIFVSLSVF